MAVKPALVLTTVLLGLLVVYWAALFFWQRTLLFPAPSLAGAPARPHDAKSVWLETAAGKVEAWYLPPLVSVDAPAPLLLFTHGNGELIDYWPDDFQEPRRWGVAVLLVEYPGYGRSGGAPTLDSLTAGDDRAWPAPGSPVADAALGVADLGYRLARPSHPSMRSFVTPCVWFQVVLSKSIRG